VFRLCLPGAPRRIVRRRVFERVPCILLVRQTQGTVRTAGEGMGRSGKSAEHQKRTPTLWLSPALSPRLLVEMNSVPVSTWSVVGSTGCSFGAAQIGNVRVASEDDWAA
jgi:hypothetical protein